MTVVGVEGSTALVGTGVDQSWQVVGQGSVTIFGLQRAKRYTGGETVKLFPA